MKRAHPKKDEASLRPIGVAFAAVVAGLGATQAQAAPAPRPHAPVDPAGQGNIYVVDPTNHPGFEEDPDFVVGRSEPTAPLASAKQRDLFKG